MKWTAAHRRKLEAFSTGDLPLRKAINAALHRIEDLEGVLQSVIDVSAECSDGDTPSMARARRLLEGKGE